MNRAETKLKLSVVGGTQAGKTFFLAGLARGNWLGLNCEIDNPNNPNTAKVLDIVTDLSKPEGGIAPKTSGDPVTLNFVLRSAGKSVPIQLSDYRGEDFHGKGKDPLFTNENKDADGVFLLLNPGMDDMQEDRWPGLSADIGEFLRALDKSASKTGRRIPVALVTTASDRLEPDSTTPLSPEARLRYERHEAEIWRILKNHPNLPSERFRVSVARPVGSDQTKLKLSEGDANTASIPVLWMIRVIRKERLRRIARMIARYAMVSAVFLFGLGVLMRESRSFRESGELDRNERKLADYKVVSEAMDPSQRCQEEEAAFHQLTNIVFKLEQISVVDRHEIRREQLLDRFKSSLSRHVLAWAEAKVGKYVKNPLRFGSDDKCEELDRDFEMWSGCIVAEDTNRFEECWTNWTYIVRGDIQTQWIENDLKTKRDTLLNVYQQYTGNKSQDESLHGFLNDVATILDKYEIWEEFVEDSALAMSITNDLPIWRSELLGKFRRNLEEDWNEYGKTPDKSISDKRIRSVFRDVSPSETYRRNFEEEIDSDYTKAVADHISAASEKIAHLKKRAVEVTPDTFSDFVNSTKTDINNPATAEVSAVLANRLESLLRKEIFRYLDHYVDKPGQPSPAVRYYKDSKTPGSPKEREDISKEYKCFREFCQSVSGRIEKEWNDAESEKNLPLKKNKINLWKPLHDSTAFLVAHAFAGELQQEPNDRESMKQTWTFNRIEASSKAKAKVFFNSESTIKVFARVESYVFEASETDSKAPPIFKRRETLINKGSGTADRVKAGQDPKTLVSHPTSIDINPWKLLVVRIDINGPAGSGMDRGFYDFRLYLDNGTVKATPILCGGSIEKLKEVTLADPTWDGKQWKVVVTHKKFSVSFMFSVSGEDPNHLWNNPPAQ